jgi:stage II sporulation protein D
MRRGVFLAGLACGVAAGRSPAGATGGLDVEDTPPAPHLVRVLLAAGSGFAAPQPVDAAGFRWNNLGYRGTFAVVTLPDGTPGLVNTLPLDAYLYGVVSKEVSPAWPRAAQEAQAIVARTYALGKLRPDRLYDVLPGESDQRYGGLAGESVEGRGAVDATAGLIVTAAGQPARVAFSSCCGGFTADAGEVWGRAFPYLPAHADPYCAAAPVFRWKAEVPYGRFVSALGAECASLGPLERIELRSPDPSGRPRSLAFFGAGRTWEIKTPDFRARLGYAVVKSTLVRAVALGGPSGEPGGPAGGLGGPSGGPGGPSGGPGGRAEGPGGPPEGPGSAPWGPGGSAGGSGGGGPRGLTVTIEGNGNGHGVGMCQWGARGMAAAGASSREIIAFYFPATALGRG